MIFIDILYQAFSKFVNMQKIQMVDLAGQYQKIEKEINQAVLDVMRSSAFINGPAVKNFEEDLAKFLGVKHVIGCANGTDALQVCLMALDLKPNDEVITTDFTFIATAEVIELLGLKSVLVDVDYDSFNINTEALEAAITDKTKAIIPVHLFGQAANMDRILEIAKKYDLKVIEDTAQALGAGYCSDTLSGKAGTFGELGATSFFPSKNLGCYGDGGAIFTNDDELNHKIRGIVNHGMYTRYYHDIVGVNSRLDSMQAAILGIKLKKLNEYNSSRQKAANRYTELLKELSHVLPPKVGVTNSHVFHQYTLKITDGSRDELKKYLDEKGIPNAVYYPVPLHEQKAYKKDTINPDDFPVSNLLAKEVLSLPMHSELEEEQIVYICDAIKSFYK